MAEPEKKPGLLQRALNSVLGLMTPKEPDLRTLPMVQKISPQEALKRRKAAVWRAFGTRNVTRELRSGAELIVPGPGGSLPRINDFSKPGGFFNPLTAKGGKVVGPAQSYATPATHVGPRPGTSRIERLAAIYDRKKLQGEKLPDWDSWFLAQPDY